MATTNDDELKKIMDAIANGATHMVATPETIEQMKQKGMPIVSRFVTYEEYVETLYSERKKNAVPFLRQLPKIDDSIADGIVTVVLEDIRASLAFGIFSSSISNSIFLLEYAMRARIYTEKIKTDINFKWLELEKMTMHPLIKELFRLKIITEDQEAKLLDFKKTIRNPYLHANFRKLSEGIIVQKLPGVNVSTNKTMELKDVDASENRYLWWAGKRFFDKFMVIHIIQFCFMWVNTLLAKK